jgi:FMN-dependent NADH-azoreductase
MYATSEQGKALEHQESYLQAIFAFVGITDVRLVRAEGLAMGDEAKAKAMSEASNSIALLAA